MDEDDLLDPGFQEKDLRRKLQSGGASRSGEDYRVGFRDFHREEQQTQDFDRRERLNQYREGGSKGAFLPHDNRDARAAHGERQGPGGEYNPHLELRKEAEKTKNKSSSSQRGNKSSDSVKCFRCTEVGHHQLDCTNDPICYKCKQPGHMAVECASMIGSK